MSIENGRAVRTTTLYHGHVLDVLAGLREGSFQCCVTSPPYWGLRDYKLPPQVWDAAPGCAHEWGEPVKTQGMSGGVGRGTISGPQQGAIKGDDLRFQGSSTTCCICGAWRGCLGLEPTVQLYVQHMVQVFRAVWRVLRDDGTLWLNLGDSYAYAGGAGLQGARGQRFGRRHTQEPLLRHRASDGGTKPKNLMGVPWRVALALQDDGWFLRSEIIWSKPAPMPESVRDRPTRAHEHIFLLTKSGAPQFWVHRDGKGTRSRPAAEYRWVHKDWGVEVPIAPDNWRDKESPWKRINLWTAHDYFYDADAVREPISAAVEARPYKQVFNSAREDVGQPGASPPRRGCVTKRGFLEGAHGTAGHDGNGMRMPDKWSNPAGRNMRTVWEIGPEPCPDAHFATFPSEIPRRAILAGTSAAGCCAACGAPWARETVRRFERQADVSGARSVRGNGTTKGQAPENGWQGVPRGRTASTTTGWRPSCECGDGPAPCIVLDPFLGSGRTGVTALELGRSFVGIDLSHAYLETIARPAIEAALQAQVGEEEPPVLSVVEQGSLW